MEAEFILTSVRADNGKASVIAGGRFAAVFGSYFKPSKSRMPSFSLGSVPHPKNAAAHIISTGMLALNLILCFYLNINQLAVIISRYKHSGIQHMDKAAAFPAALILFFEYTSILKR